MAEIKSIPSYKTSDGEIFLDRDKAMAHEVKLEEAAKLEEHRAEIERTVQSYIADQANKGVKGFDSERGRKQKANVARGVVEWLATWDRGLIEMNPEVLEEKVVEVTPSEHDDGEKSMSEVLQAEGTSIPATEQVEVEAVKPAIIDEIDPAVGNFDDEIPF